MSDATRLRKPRLFVQVARSSPWCELQYIDAAGRWSWWDDYHDRWFTGSHAMSAGNRLDILRTHVEVPL